MVRFHIALGAAILAMSQISAGAASYPDRTLRLVIPFAPGGPADVAGRVIAQQLTAALHQNVIVENKPGGGGIVADSEVARAPKDGYTLLLETPSFPINSLVRTEASFKLSDLAPVSQIVSQPYAILIPAALPAKTVQEFVAYAKSRPGALNFAASGVGSSTQLLSLRFIKMAGIQMTGIQYLGQAPGEEAVVAGDVQMLFDTPLTAIPVAKTGKARIIGVTSDSRMSIAPDIATVKEQGLPLVSYSWYGIFTTAGTPQPVIDVLNREIVKAVSSDLFQTRVAAAGATPTSSTPAELQKLVDDTLNDNRDVIQTEHIKIKDN